MSEKRSLWQGAKGARLRPDGWYWAIWEDDTTDRGFSDPQILQGRALAEEYFLTRCWVQEVPFLEDLSLPTIQERVAVSTYRPAPCCALCRHNAYREEEGRGSGVCAILQQDVSWVGLCDAYEEDKERL